MEYVIAIIVGYVVIAILTVKFFNFVGQRRREGDEIGTRK